MGGADDAQALKLPSVLPVAVLSVRSGRRAAILHRRDPQRGIDLLGRSGVTFRPEQHAPSRGCYRPDLSDTPDTAGYRRITQERLQVNCSGGRELATHSRGRAMADHCVAFRNMS